MRTGGCCQTVDREISRFPRKERLHMPGSLTTPGRPNARDDAPGCVAFRHLHGVGTQNRNLSRLNGWPMRPLSTLRRDPRGPLRMTRGRCGSLLLHRKRLALSTPCRSPGASQMFSAVPPIADILNEFAVRLRGDAASTSAFHSRHYANARCWPMAFGITPFRLEPFGTAPHAKALPWPQRALYR